MADRNELEQLRDEIRQLREEVAALGQSIADARGRVKLSMREQIRCPDCGARRIARIDQIPDFGYGAVFPLGLAYEDRGVWRGKRPRAPLQVYVCTECGLVEWRLPDTALFDGDGDFEILESEDPGQGPYR